MAIKTPGEELIILPKEILNNIKTATAEELKMLIYCFSEPDSSIADASRAVGITVAQGEAAYAFWRGAGIFTESDGKKKTVAKDTSVYRNYTSDDISNAVEVHADFAMVRDFACERLQKHTLTKNDLSALLYLFDFAGIPAPMICGVIEDCAANEKKNMQYIFKTALALYEDGIDTYEKFENYLVRRAAVNSSIGKLRKLCGMGDRALTTKEKKLFDTWFGDWSLPFEIVEFAYEKTVDATGKVNMNYMNGILRRWHESGFASVEEIKNGDVNQNEKGNSSFEGDEFIEAALARGFDDI